MKNTIELGALADPVSKQLAGILPSERLETLDRLAEAITLLVVRGLLNETQAHSARLKLIKLIQADARKFAASFNARKACETVRMSEHLNRPICTQ